MQNFISHLLMCSYLMSVLALIYIALTPLLSKRYSIKSRYYAWLIIILGFIIPFRPRFRNVLVKIDLPKNIALIPSADQLPAAAPTLISNAQSPSVSIPWNTLITAGWLLGMLLFLIYHIIKHYRFLKLASRWSEPTSDENMLTIMQTLKIQMGINKDISLQTCECIGSPMLIGIIHPKILMPAVQFTQDEYFLILKHELIHYRQKDLWYKYLVLLAAAIHWFNPIMIILTRVIDIQCELACDEQVVLHTDSETRQSYSKTILGVVRFNSKLKTALSTNFYGGKKDMKKRIKAIMDTKQKKTGIAVLSAVMAFTLGSGIIIAANEKNTSPEIIREHIVPSSYINVAFMPDPELYAAYSAFGITISEDGTKLLYNGEPIRLFIDQLAVSDAFYWDENGHENLSAVRNSGGEIIGIETITAQDAKAYYDTFFKEELNSTHFNENYTADTKFDQYKTLGIEYSDGVLYYQGTRVKTFIDELGDNLYESFWNDPAGTINLSVIRNELNQITDIKKISDDAANEYQLKFDTYEQQLIDRIENKY